MTKLKEKYSLRVAISFIITGIIGTGIFFKVPGLMKAADGNPLIVLMGWIIAGIIVFSIVLPLMEIASAQEASTIGDSYKIAGYNKIGIFTNELFIHGFFGLSVATISYWASNFLLEALGIEETALNSFLITIGSVTFLFALNTFKSKWTGTISWLSTFIKLFPLLIIIILGVFHNGGSDTGITNPKYVSGIASLDFSKLIVLILGVMPGVFYAYDGFESLSSISSEIIDPTKNVVKALFIGISIIIITYVLFTIAYFNVIPNNAGFIDSTTNDVLTKLVGSNISKYLNIFIVISAYSLLNIFVLGYTRAPYIAATQNETLWSNTLSKVNEKLDSPIPSCIYAFVSSILIIVVLYLVGISFKDIGYKDFMDAASNLPTLLGLFLFASLSVVVLRNRFTKKFTPKYKSPLIWVTTPIAFICTTVILINSSINYYTSSDAFKMILGLLGVFIVWSIITVIKKK